MGSVQKRTYTDSKPARYIGRVRVGGREQTKSFDRQKDAKEWVRERESLNPTGARLDRLTIDQAFKARLKDPDVSTKTLRIRGNVYDNLGRLRHMRVADVSPDDVKLWRLELLEGREWRDGKPLAPRTVNTYVMQLSALFNQAVAEGQIVRNPARQRRTRNNSKAKPVDAHHLISEHTVRELIDAAEGDMKLMIRLAAVSGLRIGELCGLRCRSIGGGVVQVREQAAGTGEPQWSELKTAASLRDVPIPDSVERALLDHVERCGRSGVEPLFISKRGYQYRTGSADTGWRWLVRSRGVDAGGHTWHSLRHLYATKLIQSGASVTTVQRRLGHTKPTVTLETYSHFWPGEDDRTREVFEGW